MISFSRQSWVEGAQKTEFPIQNLPFGIFTYSNNIHKIGVAIGSKVLDLSILVEMGFINLSKEVVINRFLNDFIELGKLKTNKIRLEIADLLDIEVDKNIQNKISSALIDIKLCTLYLPIKIGDYTDFYSSKDHAKNVGKMFRDPSNALLPNWLHIPVGYHGRASSIMVSNTEIHRPKGQIKPVDTEDPIFSDSKRVDFELEVGFVIGKSTKLGEVVTTKNAEDHIFGLFLFNDLSARDIQQWEYVPLGPFLGKNFGSIVSPWVVTLEALEQFRVASEIQNPKVLPYLEFEGKRNFDLNLEVSISPNGSNETVVSKSNFKYMYWNMAQQLAHHTSNGCNINVGDVMASGTISGPNESEFGSMLELAWKGTKPLEMKDGSKRVFLNDFDKCTIRGYGLHQGVKIGFGDCSTTILPSINV